MVPGNVTALGLIVNFICQILALAFVGELYTSLTLPSPTLTRPFDCPYQVSSGRSAFTQELP